jgi:hypothetical protein
MDICKMTRDHTLYMIGSYYLGGIQKLPFSTDKSLVTHLYTMFRIWAGNSIVNSANELLEHGYCSPDLINDVREN